MSKRTKIQLYITIIIGCVFLAIGIYQWYDLYQIENGLKSGSLSIILHKIYDIAGKWGVAAFYMIFSIYCFWRANTIYRISKAESNSQED